MPTSDFRHILSASWVYDLPAGKGRRFLNNSNRVVTKNDAEGKPVVAITQRVRRCSFQSLEFMDIDIAPAPSIPPIPSPLG